MKVLVIQQRYGIGDQVIFTNFYHILSKKLRSPLTLLSKRSSRPMELFAEDNHIEDIIYLDKENDGIFGFFKLLKKIKSKKFDKAFIFNGSLRYYLIAKLARIKSIYQYPLFTSKDIIFDTAKKLTESFVKTNIDTQPHLILKQETINKTKAKLKFDKDLKHIVLGISASGKSTKLWPIDNFIKLSEKIMGLKKSKFYLACGSEDKDLTEKILKSKIGKDCLSMQDLNIQEIMPIIKNCNFYIGNDTGFMHISSALGLKCIGIFGDSPAYAYSAYSKNIKAVVPEGETLETTTHNTCGIHKVSTEKVFDTLKNLLN